MPKRGHKPKPLYEPCAGGGVHLRVPAWADFEYWVELRRTNREYLQPWEPSWKPTHLSRQSYKARLEQFKTMIAKDEAYPFHVFRSTEPRHLVGACNLTNIKRGPLQSAHIGYWIGRDFVRQGYARASLRAVTRFAFEDLGLHRLTAAVQESNHASIKLLEGTGFGLEGKARSYLKVDGNWQDHLIYGRLATD